MESNSGFWILDHTADIGVRAWGGTLADVFASAAQGMFSIITDLDAIQERETLAVTVHGPDSEALLVNWLNELLYRFEAEGFLCRRCDVTSLSDTSLSAVCRGERVDLARHPMHIGIKAATYHGIKVLPGSPATVEVILDI